MKQRNGAQEQLQAYQDAKADVAAAESDAELSTGDEEPAPSAGDEEQLTPLMKITLWREAYDTAGYFVLVNRHKHTAAITRYGHCSCYDSEEGMSHNYTWQGTWEELFAMADGLSDPKMPARRLQPDDHGYETWKQLYAGISAWRRSGCPDWHEVVLGCKGLRHYGRAAPPVQTWLRYIRAAEVIQAAFRGWQWRKQVLWNPNHAIGMRRLAAEARAHCS